MVIWDVLVPIYVPVPSEDKWKSTADEFYERWNFPNCIEAIVGKPVMTQMPLQLQGHYSTSPISQSYF